MFLNYLLLLFKAFNGMLTKAQTEDLCRQYCADTTSKKIKRLLFYQLQAEGKDSLVSYVETCGSRLWPLYLEVYNADKRNLSMERTLFSAAPMIVFTKIDKLTRVAEQELFEAFAHGQYQEKVKFYVSKFALSPSAFKILLRQTETFRSTEEHTFYENLLCTAVQYLAEFTIKPNALSDSEVQLRLLNFGDNTRLMETFLHFYDMQEKPDALVTQRLIELGKTHFEYLKEVLSHSYFGEQMKHVYRAYPSLKAELLLSEIAHKIILLEKAEAKAMRSLQYQSLILSDLCTRQEFFEEVGQQSDQMLLKCLQLSQAKQPQRIKILESAVRYCEQRSSDSDFAREFTRMATLLKRLVAEEKKKAN